MHSFLLKPITIGLLLATTAYALAWLIGATSLQAFGIAAWLFVVPHYAYAIRSKLPSWGQTTLQRSLAVILLCAFQFVLLVLPAFGYRLDPILLVTACGMLGGWLLLRRFVMPPILHWIAVSLIIIGAAIILVNQMSICTIVICRPQAWSEQLTVIQAGFQELPANKRFDTIYARHNKYSTIKAGSDLNLDITISFVQSTPTINRAETPYAMYDISYNDRDPKQTLHVDQDAGWTSLLPAPRPQEAWSMVRVGPREALTKTMDDAERLIGYSLISDYASASLDMGAEVSKRFGTAAVWHVRYSTQEQQLELWLDAQTGSILEQEQKVYSK